MQLTESSFYLILLLQAAALRLPRKKCKRTAAKPRLRKFCLESEADALKAYSQGCNNNLKFFCFMAGI
jgi:hypothetical protein